MRAKLVDGLMMQRVYPLPLAPEEGVQLASEHDLHGLFWQRRVQAWDAEIGFVNALMQRSP
jgi:hypothetical protein